ncbi:hypothetical protein ACSZNO_21050 [Aeromonas veronii]
MHTFFHASNEPIYKLKVRFQLGVSPQEYRLGCACHKGYRRTIGAHRKGDSRLLYFGAIHQPRRNNNGVTSGIARRRELD